MQLTCILLTFSIHTLKLDTLRPLHLESTTVSVGLTLCHQQFWSIVYWVKILMDLEDQKLKMCKNIALLLQHWVLQDICTTLTCPQVHINLFHCQIVAADIPLNGSSHCFYAAVKLHVVWLSGLSHCGKKLEVGPRPLVNSQNLGPESTQTSRPCFVP